MQAEYISSDADMKLGAGDNEGYLEQDDEDEMDIICQLDNTNESILDDIDEVEESNESTESERESTSEDSESNEEDSVEMEDETENAEDGRISIENENEGLKISESNDKVKSVESDRSRTKVVTVRDINRMTISERPREYISLLGAETFIKTGAAKMVLQSGKHSAQLKDEVCSAGGTTIAGVHALEKGGLRCTMMDAVEAATKRAVEMEQQSEE